MLRRQGCIEFASMTIKKKTNVPARKAKGKPEATDRKLRAPRWNYWIAKEILTLEEATALSLGVEPMRGLVGLLRLNKRRVLNYRRQKQALKADYGNSPWLPRGSSLPDRYRVRGVLEYASEQKWVLQKNVVNALARLRHSTPQSELGTRGVERPPEAARPRSPGMVEISVPKVFRVAYPEATSPPASELGKRAEENLQRTLGALILLVEKLVVQKGMKAYLRGNSLNTASLARSLVKLISEEEEANIPVTGSGQRAVEIHISNALKLFPNKAKSFKIDDEDEAEKPNDA